MSRLAPSGPLLGYEVAFLRRGDILVRDYGGTIIVMWLTATGKAG